MNLGRYEVVRELGKGAMGVVYLAKDPLIGRLVALKTIRMAAGADDEETKEFTQRFIREAQAAGILSHPSIVTVHDIGQSDENGISFIAMEYVEGHNLKEVLTKGDKLSYAEIAEIAAQVAEALDYAHTKGIVHRDVKPANIILCGDSRAKITDFGIAKIASSMQNLTTTGQFLGTPNYMAPEQVKGGQVDGRTDIFSLGIVLYEALTRRKPFAGDSLTTISYKIVHEPFPPLGDVDPQIPEGFDAVVAKCLSKNPAERYQRARDLANDLRKIEYTKPRPVDDVGAESTMIFREETQRIPTMEMPFPEADESGAAGPAAGESQAPAGIKPETTVPKRPPRLRAAIPIKTREEMLTLAKRPIPPTIFYSIAGLALLLLAGAVGWIWSQRAAVPVIDGEREALIAKQRELRIRGASLLRAGNVEGSYATYQQLQKLAPKSPAVAEMMRRLEYIRTQQLSEKQRLSQARAKLEEGKKLYEAKDYAKAIALFEESFNLDPNLAESVNYLRMSREQIALDDMKTAKKAASSSSTPKLPVNGTLSGAVGSRGANAPPSALLTVFDSPVSDGYVLVKVGGQTLLHENLWEERRGILRRKAPRNLNILKAVSSETHEVEVWVVVQSLKIQEHRVMKHAFQPGAVHRLVVKLDSATKKVDIQIS